MKTERGKDKHTGEEQAQHNRRYEDKHPERRSRYAAQPRYSRERIDQRFDDETGTT